MEEISTSEVLNEVEEELVRQEEKKAIFLLFRANLLISICQCPFLTFNATWTRWSEIQLYFR